MESFTLMKVVDPHKNMPLDIKNIFMEVFATGEHSNDSVINWCVGEYQEDAEDDYEPKKFARLKKIDDWAMLHFESGENIFILFYW